MQRVLVMKPWHVVATIQARTINRFFKDTTITQLTIEGTTLQSMPLNSKHCTVIPDINITIRMRTPPTRKCRGCRRMEGCQMATALHMPLLNTLLWQPQQPLLQLPPNKPSDEKPMVQAWPRKRLMVCQQALPDPLLLEDLELPAQEHLSQVVVWSCSRPSFQTRGSRCSRIRVFLHKAWQCPAVPWQDRPVCHPV